MGGVRAAAVNLDLGAAITRQPRPGRVARRRLGLGACQSGEEESGAEGDAKIGFMGSSEF